jgi:hypothetical protein
VSTNVSGLTAGTTYHFRLVATNAAGTTAGADQTLATSPGDAAGPQEPPATTNPPPEPSPAATAQTATSLCAPTLVVRAQRRARILRHGLHILVKCSPAGSIAAALVADIKAVKRLHLSGHKPLVVARSRRSLTAPGSVNCVLRLSRRARIALARTNSVTLTLKVVATDANGVRHVLTRRLKIRRGAAPVATGRSLVEGAAAITVLPR